MTITLQPVPDSPDVPFAVTKDRVFNCLENMDLLVETTEANAIASVVLDGLPFVVCLDEDSQFLSIRCEWDTLEPYPEILDRLFAVANSWNRERYFPTVYLTETAAGNARVVADFVTPVRLGLTYDQLENWLSLGFSTCADAMFYMQDSADSLFSIVGAVPGISGEGPL